MCIRYCCERNISGGGQKPSSQPAAGGETNIAMAIVHPEIIVVQNAMTMDTHALILSVSAYVLLESYVILCVSAYAADVIDLFGLLKCICFHHFLPRCIVCRAVFPMSVCPSVCPSVCQMREL